MWSFASKSFVLLLLMALIGCGSDSDSEDEGGGDTDNPAQTSAADNLALGTGSGDSFQEGQIDADTTSLSAGGVTSLSFNIVDREDGNTLYSGDPVEVSIGSGCLSAAEPLASLDGPRQFNSGSGDISVQYTAEGCVGLDSVTAQVAVLDGDSATTTGEGNVVLEIAPPTAESITIGAPDPQSLAPINAQTDSRPSISRVEFRVLGEGGAPVQGQEINFALSYDGGDALSEGAPRLETESATTGSSGTATARVKAGKNNAIVRVVATLNSDSRISTTSLPIAINSMMPHQNGFSISATDFKQASLREDGVTAEITIRANDRLGNHVSDTIVNFVTSAGAIESECVLNDEGVCSVTWVSQNPRRDDARVTIMARTVGEESFTDTNGNGLFDEDESFDEARGEPFLNVNWSPGFDADGGDTLFDKDGDGEWTGPSGDYVGTACPEDADYCTKGTLPIWADITGFWMASEELDVSIDEDPSRDDFYCATAWGVIEGTPNEPDFGSTTPPPSGTSISFELDGDLTLKSATSDFEVDNSGTELPFVEECIEVVEADGSTDGSGTLSVTVDSIAKDDLDINF